MRVLRQAFWALAVMVASLPSWAEEEHHAGGGTLPQLRPEHFAGQIFWLAIAFGILYFLMKTIALPKVGAVQETRHAKRAGDLAEAAAANDAAKHIVADYEKSLAAARHDSQRKLAAIIEAAQKQAAAQTAEQQGALDAKLAEADKRIAAMREQALGQVRGAAIEVVPAMLARLIDDESLRAASPIESAIDAMQRTAGSAA
ncbi:MAG: F0F1 ATP synthase subunit B' [Alphaproteobacteria bacterium]